jgi:WD40 repeat protein
MNKRPYSQILDSLARDHVSEKTDLAAPILARIQKGKSATMQPRMRMFVTAALVLLVLMIVLANVPAVRAAIQRWFGYVPDVGLVGAGEMRVLAEPVSVTRDGITLTVEKVVVDSTRTTVIYKVENLSAEIMDYNKPSPAVPGCYQDAFLRLPEAELTPTDQDGNAWNTGYQHRASYQSIPAGIDDLTFVVPCIRFALPGKAPENWELPLHLISAPPEMTVFPVFEIPTSTEPTATAAPQSGPEFPTDKISLTLDRAVQMDDGYLLYATLHWAETGFNSVDVYEEMTRLLDANGQEIPFVFDHELLTNVESERGHLPIALKTSPIPVPGPLTLAIDTVSANVDVDARFTFDPGPDPQPGQMWQLDQHVELGHGHSLRVLNATYPTPPPIEGWPQEPGLSFEMESDTEISNASVADMEHPLGISGGGGSGSFPGPFSAGFKYAEKFPEGPITIEITSIWVNLPGHWEAQWTPPVSAAQAAATPEPEPCLTRESWQQALAAPPPLPAGMDGTLAFMDIVPPDNNYGIMLAHPDGSDFRSIGPGSSPSLSPDGTRVVYMEWPSSGTPNGLFVTDLVSGSTVLLPGTVKGDDLPLWSPDGTRIAFTRGPSSGLIGAPGPYNIFVVNVDGSDLSQITNSPDVNQALAWLPDGNHLLFATSQPDNASLQIIDVQTGEVQQLFEGTATAVISPDGKRLAFGQSLPLEKYGLFVSDLDGSNRRLLSNGHPYFVTVPMWSPDGQWVIASIHDPAVLTARLALIHPDTCQIVPLSLNGYVTSWLP